MRYGIMFKNNENQVQTSNNNQSNQSITNAHRLMSTGNIAQSDQSIINKNSVSPIQTLSNSNKNSMMGNAGTSNNNNSNNQQYGKSTENILQKLSEMKLKMQNLVNNQNKN